MKKSTLALLVTLFSLSLSSCGSGPTGDCGCERREDAEKDEIVLAADPNPNYTFDETSSNVNGSMSYEIFVRSFYDANGDGIGDLNGVKEKIPYLADLGIKTVWLTPIYKSPSYHGYDIIDYYSVHPEIGTINDYDALVAKANEYNIDIMLDMVFNHSSIQCPWFDQSYVDYINNNTSSTSKKDWYHWGTGNCHYKNATYEGDFSDKMPDLNIESESLKTEIAKIVKFWVNDHGTKGFRLDAVPHYVSGSPTKNTTFLNFLKSEALKYDPNFYMVGEAWDPSYTIMKYYNSNCDSFFAFPFSFQFSTKENSYLGNILLASKYAAASNRNNKWLNSVIDYEQQIKNANPNSYASYFLTNHDGDRTSTYISQCTAKLAASIYCLMPGTPFMYYGEEIELVGARVTSPDDQNDVRRRLPIIWSNSDKTGECKFPDPTATDLDDTVQVSLGVNDKLATNYSLLNHYKKVINVRNKYPLFKHGILSNVINDINRPDNDLILAYKVSLGNEYVIVVHNLNDYAVEMTAPGSVILDEINTSQLVPQLKDGKLGLGAYSTVVMR